jgi:hypothetical protein
MPSQRLAKWEAAVKRRRAGILRALRKLKSLRPGPIRAKVEASLLNMELYGIMNRHQQHWHKINGRWYKNSIRTRVSR